MAIRIGIGSWADDAYVGALYPADVPKRERLAAYARRFNHVEVNSSYYALPKRAVVQAWVEQTPEPFTFSVKLHRAVSQSPAKAGAGDHPDRLLQAVEPLIAAKRLACFLLVLPPRFTPDRHSLQELAELAQRLRPHALAVELRDKSWVAGPQRSTTLQTFQELRLVWVAVDMPRIKGSSLMPAVDAVTHPGLAYLRLHGRNPRYLEAASAAEGHHYAYSARQLTGIADRARTLSQQARDVFVIANNHAEDFAPKAALALQAKLPG